MKTMTFSDLRARVADKKRELGWSDSPEATDRLRNKGDARTPRKRELLSRIDGRARAAGFEPIRSYY